MRRGSALLLALAATAAPGMAWADYRFDAADLPADFSCDTASRDHDCDWQRRQAAWRARYFEKFDYWFHDLLFNPDDYFPENRVPDQYRAPADFPAGGASEGGMAVPPTGNLVDAVYTVALRRFSLGWAFAIDFVCPADRRDTPAQCRPVLRTVRIGAMNRDAAQAPQWRDFLPVSRAETARLVASEGLWREADLRSCPGAMKHLLTLPAQRGQVWDRDTLDRLTGHGRASPDDIVVTADGDGVLLRVRGAAGTDFQANGISVVYRQWNGGDGYVWAKRMADIVQPCLVAPRVAPPWQADRSKP